MATAAVERMFDSNHFTEEQMIAWENKPDANQIDITIMKTYFTKIYRDHLQYSKAFKGTMRFSEATNQSYKKAVPLSNEDDQTAIMFTQMEQFHQEQMDKMQQTMQKAEQ